MGLEVQVGGEQLQVAVADVLAVLEPQLDLGVMYDLSQVPHRHPPPRLLEHTQERLLQVFSLVLQVQDVRARDVVEELVGGGVPASSSLGAQQASRHPCAVLSVSLQ